MFQPGDLVVYGTTGVCQVVEITRPNMRGVDKNQEYYLLRPLQQDGVVYAPVGGENIVTPTAAAPLPSGMPMICLILPGAMILPPPATQ